MWWLIGLGIVFLLLLCLGLYDIFQTKHSILRNYPIVGHGRYFLEELGPKLRQYIVAGNNEERPFSRDMRHWVYASSNKENNYFGFGTDNDLEQTPSYLIIKQSTFPIVDTQKDSPRYDPEYNIPCAKILGGAAKPEACLSPELDN